jgi:hypothetical protein
MIDLLAAKRRCTPMGGVLRVGGSSSSRNETSQNDARITGGDGSTNATVTGDHSSVTLTDRGAVSGALNVALKGVESAYSFASQAQASSGTLLAGVLGTNTKQQEQFTSAVEKIKTSDVRVLVIVGLGVVGLAAVMLFKKG